MRGVYAQPPKASIGLRLRAGPAKDNRTLIINQGRTLRSGLCLNKDIHQIRLIKNKKKAT